MVASCGSINFSPRQTPARRSADRSRIGSPAGGLRGPFPSSAHRASRISSMLTGAISPSGARKAGHDAMADPSDAHEAKIALAKNQREIQATEKGGRTAGGSQVDLRYH